jgi:hypothetical protein
MASDRELSGVREKSRSVDGGHPDQCGDPIVGGAVESCRGESREAPKHLPTARTMYREVAMIFWLKKAEAEPGPGW